MAWSSEAWKCYHYRPFSAALYHARVTLALYAGAVLPFKTIVSFIVQIIYSEQGTQITVQNIRTGQMQQPSTWEEMLAVLHRPPEVDEAAEPDESHS